MVTSLAQLKKALKQGARLEVVKHYTMPAIEGQIKEVTKAQTNGIYLKLVGRTNGDFIEDDEKWINANGGRGAWLDFGKAENWKFEDGLIILFNIWSTNDGYGNVKKNVMPLAVYRLI